MIKCIFKKWTNYIFKKWTNYTLYWNSTFNCDSPQYLFQPFSLHRIVYRQHTLFRLPIPLAIPIDQITNNPITLTFFCFNDFFKRIVFLFSLHLSSLSDHSPPFSFFSSGTTGDGKRGGTSELMDGSGSSSVLSVNSPLNSSLFRCQQGGSQ